MWEIISATIICLFAIFGFVAFVKTLIFKIYKPKNVNAKLILNYSSECEDIEYTLRSWLKRTEWMGKTAPDSIIVIDSGLSTEQKEICSRLCSENEIFKIYTKAELKKALENDYIIM